MPSEMQLHPMKLKCKLEYKSHYMYDMIHRDHVVSAITWLKEHNSHYADIKLNEHWYNDIAAKELSVQIDENDKAGSAGSLHPQRCRMCWVQIGLGGMSDISNKLV